MAGTTPGLVLCLLLLACITEGHRDVDISCSETVEAVVGQDVALPCAITENSNLMIFSTEWTKKKENDDFSKLAVFSPKLGLHRFRPNVTINSERLVEINSIGFPLQLYTVTKWDSAVYVCDITCFPYGSLRCETELKIKDIDRITCDMNNTVKAQSGENLKIHCQIIPNAQYRWTKYNILVSEKESLELWQVTDTNTGVYTLTVYTGSKTLKEEFHITVVTVTTSLTTGLVTSSVPLVTTQSSIHSTHVSLATTFQPSPSTGQSPTSVGTKAKEPTTNTSGVTFTAEESVTPFTNDTESSFAVSTTAQTNTSHLPNSTTLGSSSTAFNQTQKRVSNESRTESTTHSLNPHNVSWITQKKSSTRGNIQNSATEQKVMNKKTTEDNERSHLLVLITVPMLLLIVVVGFLIRRRIIQQRMDLPPPFKPPPPPVKYTGAAYQQSMILNSHYPVSRCNSLADCI